MQSTADRIRLFLDAVLSEAIEVARRESVPLYTFAFYHDHESAAVSVCMDTEANSTRSVVLSNAWSNGHFRKAIDAGDLKQASLFQANVGRSLSLGDFALVNVARRSLPAEFRINKQFYLLMLRCVIQREVQLSRLSPLPDRLLFCCSGPQDEVAYVWCIPPTAAEA